MTLARVDLESFEENGAVPLKESPDYLRGFADGAAQAEQQNAAENSRAVADIASALQDMTFGFTEARIHILDRIRPLLAQIAETVLPDILNEAFAPHLIQALTQSFDDASDEPVMIAVAPEITGAVGETLASLDGKFKLVPDPKIALGQAILRRDDTQILIDFPGLLNALQTALHGLEPSERTHSNG